MPPLPPVTRHRRPCMRPMRRAALPQAMSVPLAANVVGLSQDVRAWPMDWEYVPLEDAPTKGASLLCGVPSFGMVGPVAVRFLVEHLKMRPVGGFQSDALPPTTVAWEGVVTGPIQVFALPKG